RAVTRVHDGLILKTVKQSLTDIGEELRKAIRVAVRVSDASGEQRITGEEQGGIVASERECVRPRRMPPKCNCLERQLPGTDRDLVPARELEVGSHPALVAKLPRISSPDRNVGPGFCRERGGRARVIPMG